MRAMALLMITTILLATLAGCAGTDGEVTVDLTTEELQDIIDDNKDDFLNNTTVVVFQEYHNNTTVMNTNSDTSSTVNNYNGSSGNSEIYVVRLEFNHNDLLSDIEISHKKDNNFSVEFSYYDYATNDDRTDIFTIPCSNYYDNPSSENNSNSTHSYWYNSDGYYDWWDYLHNNTVRDILHEMAWSDEVYISCRETDSFAITGHGNPVFYEINLSKGMAIDILSIIDEHTFTDESGSERNYGIDMLVNDNRGCNGDHYIICSDERDYLYGGWDDMTLKFQVRNIYPDSSYLFIMYYEIIPVSIG